MNKIIIETELTQAQIADIMGVKQPQVSNWLNGKRLPTSQNLIKLANILNYYPEELLNDLWRYSLRKNTWYPIKLDYKHDT